MCRWIEYLELCVKGTLAVFKKNIKLDNVYESIKPGTFYK